MNLGEKIAEYVAEGMKAAEICKKLKITRNAYKNARRKYKGVNPTDTRILSLETNLSQARREVFDLQKKISAYQKKAAVFEAIIEEIEDLIVPVPALPKMKKPAKPFKHVEHAVLHLSDEHMDEIIHPESVNGFEEFNFPIALARAEKLIDTTIDITQKTLSNYKFTDLWVLAYGDHTNGTIHGGVSRSWFKNQFKNCFKIAECHALMIRDLAPYFDRVHCVYVPGNHGKTDKRKDYNAPHDSWDYMIGECTRMLCANLSNVDFMIPNAYSIVVEIANHQFAIEHGDDVKSWNSIPFYGLERKTRRLSALHATQNRLIDYFVFGHFHTLGTMNMLGNSELIMNGAWKATDPFVMGAFSGFTEPSQWLHGVHPEHGVTWRYKVKLRHKEEKEGPKRYLLA